MKTLQRINSRGKITRTFDNRHGQAPEELNPYLAKDGCGNYFSWLDSARKLDPPVDKNKPSGKIIIPE